MGRAGSRSVQLHVGILASQAVGIHPCKRLSGPRVLPCRKIKEGQRLCAALLRRALGAAQLAGPVDAAIPCWSEIGSGLVAAEYLGKDMQIELANLANVVGLVGRID